MSTINKAAAVQAAGTGIPHVAEGIASLDPAAKGFGSAGDFPQDTQSHFKGVGSQFAHDDALGPDYDGD
jgi:hypothetical protein